MRKPGHIQQRGPAKFLVRWHRPTDGKQVSKIVNGDRVLAMKFLGEQLEAKQVIAEAAKRTFQSYVDNEWAYRTREVWRDSTQCSYGNHVKKHILPYFANRVLSEITPSDIVAFHIAMQKKGLAPNTRANLHAILNKMFSHACYVLELIPRSPVRPGLAPKREKIEKPALDAAQLAELLATIEIRYRAFFMLLTLTGIRTSEALGLQWADVDFANSDIHIRRKFYRGKQDVPKTKMSKRDRPMVAELSRALLNHRAMAVYLRPDDYVFASSTRRPLDAQLLRKVLKEALSQIGVTFTQPRAFGMHLLRHSSGTLAHRVTNDMKATQSWLGHSSVQVTMNTYTHQLADQEMRTAKLLAEAIFAKPEAPTTLH